MDGVDNGQVAVYSNVGQEQVVVVEVDFVQSDYSFVEVGVQDLVYKVFGYSKGQDEDQKEVS